MPLGKSYNKPVAKKIYIEIGIKKLMISPPKMELIGEAPPLQGTYY